MTDYFATKDEGTSIPIESVVTGQLASWLDQQDEVTQSWVTSSGFKAKAGEVCLVSNEQGQLKKVLFGLASDNDLFQFGRLPFRLTNGVYHLDSDFNQEQRQQIATAWALGSYYFNTYKNNTSNPSKLVLDSTDDIERCRAIGEAVKLVRDMINTPTSDMLPQDIAKTAEKLAEEYGAQFSQIVGDDLLVENFPVIHAVGRGSVHPPRLIDIRWGDEQHPKVTLVGKGVCFDSGGLNLKPPAGMRYMKKDMAGAAHVLGLAKLIMQTKLPIRLRVLIPTVENAVSGNSYHPGDIIRSRKGTTIEVTNTDAEGRLILCDALYEASSENPELLVDIATLTGAARVAVGNDISALFTQNDDIAQALYDCGETVNDPIWRLPLYEPYRKLLESPVADLVNAVLGDASGAAITAALYLSEFVPADINWVHFDIMAWNNKSLPARPEGGEAMCIRAVYQYLCDKYK